MKKQTKGFLIGGLVMLAAAGVVGSLAWATNWFTDVGKVNNLTKKGDVVYKLEYDEDLEGFACEDLEGYVIALTEEIGAKEETTTNLAGFKSALTNLELNNSQISSIWNQVNALDEAALTMGGFELGLALAEAGSYTIEADYFDYVRVNYAVQANDYVFFASVDANDDIIEEVDHKALKVGTLYEDIKVATKKAAAEDIVIGISGLNGSIDTRMNIKSIEFVRKDASKAKESVFLKASA